MYSKKIRDLSNDPSLETTNEFFRNDLTSFASELEDARDTLITAGLNDLQIRELLALHRNPIIMVLKWHLNELKQSEAIAKHRLRRSLPEFRTLRKEIELVEEMLGSRMFRDQF